MPEKIFDILPPEKKEKKREEEIKPKKEVGAYKSTTTPASISFLKNISSKKKFLFFIGILLLVFGLAFIVLPKTEIEIEPESEIIDLKTEIKIDKNLKTADFSSAFLPGDIIKIEKEVFEEFPATGKTIEEKKAEGIIRVYNSYSTEPQVLVATTRFVSTEGKLFRLIERVVIPGGHYEGGKLVPGFLNIKVRADQPGEDYNIGPSSFSIPGFAGTTRYAYFYGKSFQPMEGGLLKEVSQVIEEDLDLAKDTLTAKAQKECKAELENKFGVEELILIKQAQKIEILETSSSAEINEITERFTFRVRASLLALTFKKRDSENFVKEIIASQISSDKKLFEDSLKIDYSLKNLDLESGKGTFSLRVEAKIYFDIDENSLKKALAGKSISETKFYLESHPQIINTQIRFWPFWVKSVPQAEEKIIINLIVD